MGNLHEGHRERVKNKYLQEGNLDSFNDHELLEMLLFYAVPRKDTNELAHRLLEHYGSLYNLFNAYPQDISKTMGISENTAILITMMSHVARRYYFSRFEKRPVIDSYKKAIEYFDSLLFGVPIEMFYLTCLDINKKVINTYKMSEGTVSFSPVFIEDLVKKAALTNCRYAIIAHNHPGGTNDASSEDVQVTSALNTAFNMIKVSLLDHIIICGKDNFSFANKRFCGMRYNK